MALKYVGPAEAGALEFGFDLLGAAPDNGQEAAKAARLIAGGKGSLSAPPSPPPPPPLTSSGTDNGETLGGTAGADVIDAKGGADTVYGHEGDDYLIGGAGDDVLRGQAGSDILVGGDGSDSLLDDESGNDSLFGGDGNDFLGVVRAVGSPLGTSTAILDGGAGDDEISVQEQWSDRVINAGVWGGTGNDTITLIGQVGHVTVDAGDGDDIVTLFQFRELDLTLGAGRDLVRTYYTGDGSVSGVVTVRDFQAGDLGDRLDLRDLFDRSVTGWNGNNPFGTGHLRLIQSGTASLLQIDLNGGGDSWTDLFRFENTTAGLFTAQNFSGWATSGDPPPGQTITGTAGGEVLNGTEGNDLIQALGGDDIVYGAGGNDRIEGGDGADILYGQGGDDLLYGGTGADVLGGEIGDELHGEDGDDTLGVTALNGVAGEARLYGDAGADQLNISFAPGAVGHVTADGGADNDLFQINGEGVALLIGGAGDDSFSLRDLGAGVTLTLGTGVDTVSLYHSQAADFQLTITDFQTGVGGDRLNMLDYVTSLFVNWDRTTNPFAAHFLRMTGSGADSLLQIDADRSGHWSTLTVFKNTTPLSFTAENLGGYASDGSVPAGLTLNGTAGADNLVGGLGPDTINGLGGSDWIISWGGDDVLNGGDGDDRLDSYYGSDIVHGGQGSDALGDDNGLADQLYGDDGDDWVHASRSFPFDAGSNLILDGGAGDDRVEYFGYNGVVHMFGGAGKDAITSSASRAFIDAGDGDDLVFIYLNGDTDLTLGAGADRLILKDPGAGFGPGTITVHALAR